MGWFEPPSALSIGILVVFVISLSCTHAAANPDDRASSRPDDRASSNSDDRAANLDDRVAVDQAAFEAKLRGRSFKRWSDFKRVLGKDAQIEPEMGGEVRLMSGLSIAFVIILNVIVWAVIAYVVAILSVDYPRYAGWAVFGILCFYAFAVNAYCQHAYSDPKQRLVTNFLFGLVPLAVSSAAYCLALLILDLVKSTAVDGFSNHIFSRLKPWEESFGGRFIFWCAVLPGLIVSIHLGNTVSTGFENVTAHVDVLSLCLFIDVGRFAGHSSYLVAREWSIGKSPDSISSRPGLCYVFHILCLVWFMGLARLEAGHSSFFIDDGTKFLIADSTKIRTLVCLTSFVFFPLSLYLIYANLLEFFEMFRTKRPWLESVVLLTMVFLLAIFMLTIAVVFDAIEPNLMGIAAMLWVVFYGAWKLSDGTLLSFIFMMTPLAALMFGAVILASSHARTIRTGLLAALA